MLVNTRISLVNALFRWLAWKMQYHPVHHLFPAVPFCNLPALYAEPQPRLGEGGRRLLAGGAGGSGAML